jgi:hypothetical protein
VSDLPGPVDEKIRAVVVRYDPIRREGVVKLPQPHGRLHFFLNRLGGGPLKEQVVADSRELNWLSKSNLASEEARFREVVDQIRSLLVKREVLLEVRRSAGGQLQVRRMYEIPMD